MTIISECPRGRAKKRKEQIMKLNDIVQMWNHVSEAMAQAHQL